MLRVGRPWEQSHADRDLVIDVNVKGALNTRSAFAPLLFAQEARSALVFTVSLASFNASPGFDAYAASKHAEPAIAAAFTQEMRAPAPHVHSVLLCPGAAHLDRRRGRRGAGRAAVGGCAPARER
jgi:short-subunit dehydrogenase